VASNLQRFRVPGNKLHGSAPSATLYFYNAPPNFTNDALNAVVCVFVLLLLQLSSRGGVFIYFFKNGDNQLCAQRFAPMPLAVHALPQLRECWLHFFV
jgi:hypothetical protein